MEADNWFVKLVLKKSDFLHLSIAGKQHLLLDQLLEMLQILHEHLGIQLKMKTNAQNPHLRVIVCVLL